MSLFLLGSSGSGLYSSYGTWANTGGALPTILNDGSDGTYIKRTSASPGNAVMRQAVASLPTNEITRRIRWRCRMSRPASASVAVALGVLKSTAGYAVAFYGADTSYTGTKTATTYTGPWQTALANGDPLSLLLDSSRAQLLVKAKDKSSSAAASSSFLELGYDLETASIPQAPTVSSPSGTITDTSAPPVAWTHLDTLSATITQRASAGTTRTLTFASHAMQVGNDVTVSGVNANYDGIWKITAVTATTITFTGGSSLTEGTTAASGTATIGDAASQSAYEVRVFTAAQYGAGGFDPATSAATWESGVLTSGSSSTTPGVALVNGTTYRAYVRTATDVNGANTFGTWGYSQFTMSVTPATATLGASFDTPNNRVTLTIAGTGNVLTAQDANLETAADVGSWVANANCTITQSTTFADVGTGSLRLSSTAAGSMSARTAAGTAGYPVLGSTAYSATARLRAGASARTCTVAITWYDAAGATLSTTTGTGVADATGSFTTITVNGTSPASAVFASVLVTVNSTAAGSELHYVDKIALHPGSTPAYSPGGMTYEVALTRTPTGGEAVAVRPPLTLDVAQKATVYDYEAPRGVQSTYSLTLIGYGVLTDAVIYSTAVTSNATPTNDGTWWIKAMGSSSLNRGSVRVLADPDESREEAIGVFRLEGREDPVVVSGQMFGDDPDMEVYTNGATEWEAIKALFIDFTGTLLVQEPFTDSAGIGLQRHIRVTRRSWAKTGTPSAPRRLLKVQAIEVGKGY